MDFLLSKLLWLLARPSNLVLLLLLAGVLMVWLGVRRWGFRVIALTVVGFALVTILPVGAWLIAPLENRFVQSAPAHVDGIVVLGGTVDPTITAARGEPSIMDGAERLLAMLSLAKQHPEARVVFTGGSGQIPPTTIPEAEVVRRLVEDLGADVNRFQFEDRSRNTYENAIFSKALVQPTQGETWLLVTSAFHMPRAVGVFRQAGWPVVPYPVDYRSDGRYTFGFSTTFSVALNLVILDDAVKEWIGLVAYHLMGRTDTLMPPP